MNDKNKRAIEILQEQIEGLREVESALVSEAMRESGNKREKLLKKANEVVDKIERLNDRIDNLLNK